ATRARPEAKWAARKVTGRLVSGSVDGDTAPGIPAASVHPEERTAEARSTGAATPAATSGVTSGATRAATWAVTAGAISEARWEAKTACRLLPGYVPNRTTYEAAFITARPSFLVVRSIAPRVPSIALVCATRSALRTSRRTRNGRHEEVRQRTPSRPG